MANINKKAAVAKSVGLPTKEQILTSPENVDRVPAQIQNQDGSTAPAALTEGEFVFSIPSIIALGEGDYDQGLALLTQMHDELRAIGDQMVSSETPPQGLAAAVPMGE